MNKPPNNGEAYGNGDDGYGRGDQPGADPYGGGPYSEGPYGDGRRSDHPYSGGQNPQGPGNRPGVYGPLGQQGGYGAQDESAGAYPAYSQGHRFGQGPSGQQPGTGGFFAAGPGVGSSGGSGFAGMSPKMLGIIGGAIALVVVGLLVLVFVVFGDSEERDRKDVIKAAEKFVGTLSEGQTFSELNEQFCSRHQADERDAEEIDDEMAAMGYDIPELLYLDGDDLQELRDLSFTERDVEFTSDARREAIVYFDAVDDELTFRNVNGDWLVCDSAFDMSSTEVDDFTW